VTVAELCRRHRRIGLDSNLLIYVLEAVEPWAAPARALIRALEDGKAAGYLSAIALAEVLTGPARRDDLAAVERYNDEIRSIRGLRVAAISPDIAPDISIIRGVRRLRLPDAIHLATARAAGATAFVTNDRSIRGSTRLEVVYLDELGVDEPGAGPQTDTIG
jgi:predicted nucleic acid-binding protein